MEDRKPTILFVDDDPFILKALGRALREKRHVWNCEYVLSGAEALTFLEGESVDVLVTDLQMPGISGLELVQQVNAQMPNVKCVFLTGTADLKTATDIVNSVRVFRFYPKPCDTGDLIRGIQAGVDDRRLEEKSAVDGRLPGIGQAVLDRMQLSVLIVGADGRVFYMNQAAGDLLHERDGLTLDRSNILLATEGNGTGELRTAIKALLFQEEDGETHTAIALRRASDKSDLKVFLSALTLQDDDAENAVLLFITDPDRVSLPSAATIARFFNLTPQEARLAAEMLTGAKPEEIADRLGVTLSTIRTYTKRLMEKMDCNRQVDLIRKILCTPAMGVI